MTEYNLSYTGEQVNEAIGKVRDHITPIDTSIVAGSTAAVTGGAIKTELNSLQSILDALRPKYVSAGTSGGVNLANTLASGTGDTDYVYNVNQFTSTDSDFDSYLQIVAVHIDCFAQSKAGTNEVAAFYPDGTETHLCSASGANVGDSTTVQTNSVIPINAGQSTFTIRHSRNSELDDCTTISKITGFTIFTNLPSS